jgi:predicted dehydrogenase
VRFGIIGCGVIGQTHLQAARSSPLIDVVAVADLQPDAARETAELFEVGKVHTAGEDLVADPEVEAVVLAFPARGRAEMALRAFASGKHVLTEKPVAMNADEVRRMIAAQGDLVAGCCSSRYRFLKSAAAATDFLASGVLGELRVVRGRAVLPASGPPDTPAPAWRLSRALNGGGIMSNWGCYDLDYLLGITGWSLRPELVLAQTWKLPPQFESHVAPGSDAETHVAALIRCEGGPVITLERGEAVSTAREKAWQIIGSQGSLRLEMKYGQNRRVLHDDTTTARGVTSKPLWQGDESVTTVQAGPIHDFAAAIRERRQPKTSLEEALIVQQITDAIYTSAETGKAVPIH